jgi:tetratricopeptide (TPR) repeat protein
MDLILRTGEILEKADGQNELSELEAPAIRFARLSAWMMILGTVRLVSALGDYGSSFLDISPSWYTSWGEITRFLQEYPPAVLLGSGWPLILALLLRKPTSRGFLVAGAVTFSIMSLGGFLNLLGSLLLRSGDSMVSIGSFAIPRASLLHWNLAAAIRALMGTVQLTLELVTAVSAWVLSQSSRTDAARRSSELAESRRGLNGRLAIYVSLAFFVLYVRQPVWSAYLMILNQSNLLREFVLRNDVRPTQSRRSGFLAFPSPAADADPSLSIDYALRLASSNRFSEAKQSYLRIIARAERISRGPGGNGIEQPQLAQALNNLAWMLATCEDVQFREPDQAFACASKAVQLAGDEGTYWNTLGVAYFRLQDWDQATKALGRSMELRGNGEGDSFDWFFLAMIHASKNQKEEGRRWYDRAVAWFHENRQGDRELYQFQVEAAKALGIPGSLAPPMTAQPKPGESAQPARIRRGVRLVH